MCVPVFQLKLITETDDLPVSCSLLTSAVDDDIFIKTKEKK